MRNLSDFFLSLSDHPYLLAVLALIAMAICALHLFGLAMAQLQAWGK